MSHRVPVSELLFEYDERLGDSDEPIVLTLTEKNGFIPQEERFNKRLATADTTNYKVVRRFDIAYNQYLLWAGAIAQNRDWETGIVSPAYPTFRVREGFDPRYVDWLLAGDPIRLRYDAISFGAVPRRRRAKISDFLSIEVSEPPPLAEQKRIAGILDAADALRAKRREALTQLDNLLQSTFLDMFGDPVANPMGFPIRALSELYINNRDGTKCGPFGSALKKHELVESGVPVWNMDNIDPSGRMVLPFRMWITDDKYRELEAYSVIDGDVIISRAGTVGKMCVTRLEAGASIISTNLIRVRFGSDLLPIYFVSLMTYCKGRVGRLKTGPDGAFTHMSTGVLDKLKFPYPHLDLQHRFAALVETVEQQKARMRAHLAELDALFASLQFRAFNGELNEG